jgi:hypothetical protein
VLGYVSTCTLRKALASFYGSTAAGDGYHRPQTAENDAEKRSPYHDYGLFAKPRGPAGNLIAIIAGTRDGGVEQTSEKLTDAPDLKGIASRVDTGTPFEVLLEVGALDGVDMSGRLLFVAPCS